MSTLPVLAPASRLGVLRNRTLLSSYGVRQAGHWPLPVSRILWKHHTHTWNPHGHGRNRKSSGFMFSAHTGQSSPSSSDESIAAAVSLQPCAANVT